MHTKRDIWLFTYIYWFVLRKSIMQDDYIIYMYEVFNNIETRNIDWIRGHKFANW